MGADALFFPVVDGAQVDDLLHFAPAAFYFEEPLVGRGRCLPLTVSGLPSGAGICRRGSVQPSPCLRRS